MPIYEFECPNCREKRELVCKYDERAAQECPECFAPLEVLEGRSAPVLGKPRYQMGAVMADGRKVKGHFGKSARTKKKR